MTNLDNSHAKIVTTMINKSDLTIKYRLHGDIIPEEIEKAYLHYVGENIKKKHNNDSIIYYIGEAKFYYGGITRHPSVFKSPMIAA